MSDITKPNPPYKWRELRPDEPEAAYGIYAVVDGGGQIIKVTLSLFIALLYQDAFNRVFAGLVNGDADGTSSHLAAPSSSLDSGESSEARAEKVGGV